MFSIIDRATTSFHLAMYEEQFITSLKTGLWKEMELKSNLQRSVGSCLLLIFTGFFFFSYSYQMVFFSFPSFNGWRSTLDIDGFSYDLFSGES